MTALAATWQSDPPEQLLKERFHISAGFHPGQRDIIEQLVQGERLLDIQRTGWGKSPEICTEIEWILLSPHSSRCRYTYKEGKTGAVALETHGMRNEMLFCAEESSQARSMF